jgi:D-arabinose 1-dehydrogenase-like Zn-dependent alcohol dehydrogenase
LALAAPQTGFLDCAIMACRAGMENLCDGPTFTGYTVDGDCAQCALTPEELVYLVSESFSDE